MSVPRVFRHLLLTRWQLERAFPRAALLAIEQEIEASEATHAGQIRFVVEGALDGAPLFRGQTARERAIELFSLLRVWDTEHNCGVLIYLLLADRDVEIVADRGIHAKLGTAEWARICRQMEVAFRQADYAGGALGGIRAVTRHLVDQFPASGSSRNELPNLAVVL